jgi:hypothetical protein
LTETAGDSFAKVDPGEWKRHTEEEEEEEEEEVVPRNYCRVHGMLKIKEYRN